VYDTQGLGHLFAIAIPNRIIDESGQIAECGWLAAKIGTDNPKRFEQADTWITQATLLLTHNFVSPFIEGA
jgi:hypothetical protein